LLTGPWATWRNAVWFLRSIRRAQPASLWQNSASAPVHDRQPAEALRLSSDLTTGPVPAHLRRQAVPMAMGLVAIISFDVVDMFFVSLLGDAPLAAISFTFPVIWLISSVIIGFEAGAASSISRAIGRNDTAGARRQTTDTAALAAIVSLFLCILGLLSIRPLFRLMGATDDLLLLVEDYMSIWYWSAPLSAVTWTCLAAIRARGNTMLEGKIIMLAALVNAVLDPILIFGFFGMPRLEIAGAALATLISSGLVLIGTLVYLHTSLRVFATPFTAIGNILESWRQMLKVGFPATLTNAIVPISNGVAVAMIASYGVDAVAGYGIAVRIEPLGLIAFYALSAVTSPFMGQNFAAGKLARLEEARIAIGRFCVIYGLCLAVVIALLAYPLTGLFSDTEAIQQVAVDYLWIMAISYGGYGVVMAICAAFNGVGYPIPGLLISTSRAAVVFLPIALICEAYIGLNGIFVGAALSNVLIGVVSYLWLGRNLRRVRGGLTPALRN
jgi:putative MATE family efflux protein